MRIIIIFLLAVFSSSCFAAAPVPPPSLDRSYKFFAKPLPGVVLNFDKLPLLDFLRLVYGDILKQNYVVHPDLLDSQKLVTVHYSEPDSAKVAAFTASFLSGFSVDVEKHSGYVFLRPAAPKKEEELETFHYRPSHRSVSELMDLTAAIFIKGSFTGQRAIRSPQPIAAQSAPLGAVHASNQSATPMALPQTPRDTGTSAFSMLDKTDRDSLVFHGTKKEVEQLKALLAQLDVPLGEVLVKAVVYEVSVSSKESNAIRLFADILGNTLGVNFGVVTGNSFTLRTGALDTVLSALSTDSRFRTVTTPSLRVRSGGDARFSVGADVPVLGSVQLDKNGNPIQSVEYKPSGTIFQVKPTVRESSIDLDILQQLSNFVQTTTGVNNSPTLQKRELKTAVTAHDGDLLVLGGLDEDKGGADSSGVSFLPDWLRSRGSEQSKTQILLVLQVQRL